MGPVTESLVGGALRLGQPEEPVDIAKTRQQHSYYVEQMKEIVNGNVVQVCVTLAYSGRGWLLISIVCKKWSISSWRNNFKYKTSTYS